MISIIEEESLQLVAGGGRTEVPTPRPIPSPRKPPPIGIPAPRPPVMPYPFLDTE
jgi:hypothetical protein